MFCGEVFIGCKGAALPDVPPSNSYRNTRSSAMGVLPVSGFLELKTEIGQIWRPARNV